MRYSCVFPNVSSGYTITGNYGSTYCKGFGRDLHYVLFAVECYEYIDIQFHIKLQFSVLTLHT